MGAHPQETAPLPESTGASQSRPQPQHGARLAFLTGGTALRPLSHVLKHSTWNSIHIVTCFDSGGSSAALRRAFGIPALGDLRNRLLALAADDSSATVSYLSHRLPSRASAKSLRNWVENAVNASDAQLALLPNDVSAYVQSCLSTFQSAMPPDFDLRGASVGNLVLAGSLLARHGDLEAALEEFAQHVCVRGRVLPVAHRSATLLADLHDGTRVVGQHRITGKECAPIRSPVQDLALSLDNQAPYRRAVVPASPRAVTALETAELICYPMGSFFTSVLVNLMPQGIGRALRAARCAKVYIPNTGTDPEEVGLGCIERIHMLVQAARRDGGAAIEPPEVVDTLLVDSRRGRYAQPLPLRDIERLGIRIVDMRLTDAPHASELDPERVAEALLDLAGG